MPVQVQRVKFFKWLNRTTGYGFGQVRGGGEIWFMHCKGIDTTCQTVPAVIMSEFK